KRALQYVLQGLLGSQYNQMRPRDVDSKRKRRSQVQKLMGMKSIEDPQHTAIVAQNQPMGTTWHRPTETHLDHGGCPNEFDFLIGDVDHQGQNANLASQEITAPSSSEVAKHPTWFPLDPPLTALSAPSPLDNTNACPGVFSSVALTESLNPTLPTYIPSFDTFFDEHSLERDLFQFDGQYNVSPNSGSVALALDSSLKLGTSVASSSENATRSSRPRTLRQQDTDSVIDSLNLRGSNLSALISRLSRCSSQGEKKFVEDLLKHFSVSTLSSITNSIHSSPLMSFTQGATYSDTPPSVLLAQPQTRRTRFGLWELPGDFITSQVNTFSHHIACNRLSTDVSCSTNSSYCEGCCMSTLSSDEFARLCIPGAVMSFKRGAPAERIWLERGE
ncbi:MAG: hypothetical protein Q9224_007028, partial [Gallowayella concinna]